MNKQCSHASRGQPVWPAALLLAALLPVIPATAPAQARYRVGADENFRQEAGPAGRLLARVNAGTEVAGGATRDGWVEVTLDGWIWAGSVGPSPTEGYDLVVRRGGGENLRDTANGRVIARLLTGFLLQEVERREAWVRVRRTGWMWGRTLEQQAPAASVAPPSEPPPAAAAAAPPPATDVAPGSVDRMLVASSAALLATPRGDTLAAVRGTLPAQVLARAGGWARVRVDGWVREADLAPAADSVLLGVSGAEVRSGGAAYEGRVVRWTLQYLSVQTADELRRDMPEGRRYLLARGPMPESGFVYVLLTPRQASELSDLQPLSYLTVIARVRTARSRYLGNPILELMDHAVVQP